MTYVLASVVSRDNTEEMRLVLRDWDTNEEEEN